MDKNSVYVGVGIIILIGIAWGVFSSRSVQKDSIEKDVTEEIAYKDVTPSALSDMLVNKDFVLIDTHTPEQDHIPGTDTLIPYDEIGEKIKNLVPDKDSKIVLYCRSGSMSVIASEELVNMGYTNVYNVDGGMNEWKAAGFEVDSNSLVN